MWLEYDYVIHTFSTTSVIFYMKSYQESIISLLSATHGKIRVKYIKDGGCYPTPLLYKWLISNSESSMYTCLKPKKCFNRIFQLTMSRKKIK